MLGLLSQQLVEQQALDHDRLAGQQGGGWDRGSCGSGGQDETTYNIVGIVDLFFMYFSVFLYLFYIYQINLPAAVNATLTGSTMGAGAPETERRQHARARTTKPFGI